MASKFLMISGGGDGLGIALRLKQEGNDVNVWIREGRPGMPGAHGTKMNYDGLLSKPERWSDVLESETVVLFDSSGGGRTADRLRARGHSVLTGSTFADTLELDRSAAIEFMQQCGIKTPMSKTFHSWEKGKAWAKEFDKRLVFKASGKTGDHLGSYVSYDTGDLIEMMDHFAEIAPGKPEYILQEFIKGTEISTEGWFNGREFMSPWNHTIERKQLMNDGLGPSGGCAGNVVWLSPDSNHIISQGVAKLEPLLREHDYLGPVDLNSVVNDDGVWGLEFTPRFGYDAMPALLELFNEPLGPLFTSLARLEHPKTLPLENKHAAALRITIPPYPSEHFHSDEGIPIRGLTRDDRSHLYFYDVKLDPGNRLVSTDAYGAIVAVTGRGDGISDAFDGPMEIAKRAKIPQKQYRTDLVGLFIREWCEIDRLVRKEDVGVGLPEAKV